MVLGRDVLLEVLRTEGVRHLFGNPGSTELPLMDSLAEADDLHYVLCLQEATVVGMADGYAQATGRPAFVNLHTSAGLGNAIGNLTNAKANRAPLVITAGQQDYRHIVTDPLLSGPLVELAGGAVKWAHEVRTANELGTILRRAFHDAVAAPAGPVFAAVPMDLLDHDVAEPTPAASTIYPAGIAGGIEELADLLCGPDVGRVALVVGDAVAAAGAVAAAVALAEALGAPVHGSPLHGRGVFPPTHPLWRGMLTPAAAAVREVLGGYDRVLLIGEQAFMVYPYTPGPSVPVNVELLHLSPDPLQLGRVWPVRLGVAGDPKRSLEALLPLVLARADAVAAADAIATGRSRRAAEIDQLDATARERYGPSPMHPMAAAHALVQAMPRDSFVVDEAITTGVYVRGFHHWTEPGRYFFCTGGGLGWGMPAACGVSLAIGSAPVLCVVGDGSAMYSPQALWTAAAEGLPVVFAVVNNRQYRILKNNLRGMQGASVRADRYVGMDLTDPPVDYVALAMSMGVSASRVDHADDVGDALRNAMTSGGPHLLELPITA